jgi:hypothetical protein
MQAVLPIEDKERVLVLDTFGRAANQYEVILLQKLLSATPVE